MTAGFLTLSGRELNHSRKHLAGRRQRLFLTTCSDRSKTYMILVALVKGFQNHIGFATIRASDEEQSLPTSSQVLATVVEFCA